MPQSFEIAQPLLDDRDDVACARRTHLFFTFFFWAVSTSPDCTELDEITIQFPVQGPPPLF